MKVLDETRRLKLAYHYETISLVDKQSGQVLMEGELYGDPTCGLIDERNQWAIVGGEYLSIWTPERTKHWIEQAPRWIHAVREARRGLVEVLTDPWGTDPAIWTLDTTTFALRKERNFLDYQGTPYVDDVLW